VCGALLCHAPYPTIPERWSARCPVATATPVRPVTADPIHKRHGIAAIGLLVPHIANKTKAIRGPRWHLIGYPGERSTKIMAQSLMHLGVGARLARLCAVAATLMVGVTALLDLASAQTPPATKKPPAKAPAAKAPPAAAAASNPWVKLCEKATAATKDKDGKDEKKELNVCMTHHERIDGASGMVVVSAALQQLKVEGEAKDKQQFLVMVPTGMLLKPGMRATVFPKDLWAKVEKKEKIDKAEESKLKALTLDYTLCHAMGCTAEIEATPELISSLKTSGGLMVFALRASGAPVAFPVPLAGFEQALSGAPVDPKKYGEARKALMMQIAQRQQELAAELKKQNEALQKMQGPEAHKLAPPPAKGPAPPPAKK